MALADGAIQTYFAFALCKGNFLIARTIVHYGVLILIGLGLALYLTFRRRNQGV